MKRVFLISIILLSFLFQAGAQQIGNGYSTVLGPNGFNSALQSGIYTSGDTQSGMFEYPIYLWKYLFVMRQNYSPNNQQFQLTTNFNGDDRVFFRKLDGPVDNWTSTPWHELATRGANTFTGNQKLEMGGSFIIGNSSFSGNRLQLHHNGNNAYIDYAPNLYLRSGTTTIATFLANGNIGIGITNPTHKLEVNGTIRTKEVIVENTNWPDYVFAPDYQLPSLESVSKHIQENKHLPNIPSAQEVAEQGVSVSEISTKLLQKIEELTLYAIQQQEMIEALKEKVEKLETKK